MAQESISKVAIIGAGPCGCTCAYFLQNNCEVTLFDFGKPLRTLLPTGGGRCNFAHAEFDFKNLATNYPRGEKFLYSIFSKFATAETLALFENLGIEYYFQDDDRIFPKSNSAQDVRDKFLSALKKTVFKKEKVLRINQKDKLEIVTDNTSYKFDTVIVTTGGHNGYNIAKYLGLNIIDPKPALVGLKTKENIKNLAGITLKNITATFDNKHLIGDILFTHNGVSGPLIYKISSIKARADFPYKIFLKCAELQDFQSVLNANPHKNISNLLTEFIPKKFALYILEQLSIKEDLKCHLINGNLRDLILEKLNNFELTIISTEKEGETVTCGGIALDELNPKTLETKKIKGLYFGGEVLDIDGFCGGFNLQNCWSNAFVISQSILNQ